jgi:nicotinamidase-related amidase
MQTRFADKIAGWADIVGVQSKLIRAARALDVPVIVTEHYSKGLGSTTPEIVDALTTDGGAYEPLEKITFSCFGDEAVKRAVAATGRRTLILVGIESHICVAMTALDATAAGYDVHVVTDAIGARPGAGHAGALAKLAHHRIDTDTWEMVLYQWLRRADRPEFKKVLPIIKE